MAYCTPSELLQFIDERLISDLVNDAGVRPSPTQILTDPNVLLALSTASGQINSAALTAQRYTVTELGALTGDDANILKMLVSWLAFGILCNRRGRDPNAQPAYKETLELLNQLRRGDTLFNVAGNVGAGTAKENFPTAVNYATVNTLRTATRGFYPVRREQNVVGGGGSSGSSGGGGGSGAVSSVFSRTGAVTATTGDYTVAQVTGAAPLASPTFTGVPAAPTATGGTNTTQIATTAFVQAAIPVTSVSNTDSTLTVTPTTGVVVASLNTAHVNTWTGQQYFAATPITSTGGSIAWNLNTAQAAYHTFTESTTLANPTNMFNGGTYTLILTQNSGTAKTLAFGNAYKFPGGSAFVVSTTLSAVDILTFLSDGTHMYAVGQKGFA